MKKTLTILLTCITITTSALSQESLKKVYDENINQMTQIDEAVAKASIENKHIICQVGGNWCPWCLRFADFISNDSTINKMVNDNFIYIHVNYNPNNTPTEELKKSTEEMLKRLKNPSRFGFPVFVVLDANGNVLHIQDSSFLEEDNGYNKEKVLRFMGCWTRDAIKNPN